MSSGVFLLACCALLYAALAVIVAVRARRRVQLLLAFCCLVTAGWGIAGALLPNPRLTQVGGAADLVRSLAWFVFIFFLYRDARLGRPGHEAGFAAAGLLAAALGAAALVLPADAWPGAALVGVPLGTLSRLGLAIAELLLIENLYLNLPEQDRWHVALPSVLLGGLACFDIVLCADVVLYHQPSDVLWEARTVGIIIIAPLLMVAAARGQRWKGRVQLSRSAAFHSATLVLSGGVLLALTAIGEAFRYLSGSLGWLAEASLGFAALIAVGLLLTSASARSRFNRLFVDHFFAERYDYRRQWLLCLRTLSGEDDTARGSLSMRVIRTLASVVDSPAGVLFLRDGAVGPFGWAGSWNMPSIATVPGDHPVVDAMREGRWIAELSGQPPPPLDQVGALWLAIPLLHRGAMMGFVAVAAPRAPFPLEQEVFDLLRIVSQEVASTLGEQKATQTLLQTQQLHDYSKRFAFVAHDIKNVSSQLALLSANARHHIANPAFQKDMLATVDASVDKITALLARLEHPELDRAPAPMAPLAGLEALVATYRRARQANVVLEHDGSTAAIAMGTDALETAVTHLLNNAVEAGGASAVRLRVRHEARQVVVDVVDTGAGMGADFVRDELFRPFSTSKPGGSGIGAYQARDLVREAGGDLVVVSAPGLGTTMRLLLPRTDVPDVPGATAAPPVRLAVEA